jgi:peptidoglycan/xylan/chitin deacetylase (PgdA/CDA1 family)
MPWKDGYTISDEKSLADSDVRWPDGKRCAVHIVVDLSVASSAAGITAKDIGSAPAEFAAHEGLDLLLAALEKFRLKATFAVPAVTADTYPARIKSLIERGHEVAANGFKHEDVSKLARADEKARIELATEILTRVAGRKPAGWFSLPRQTDPFAGGTISPNTMDLLIEAGYAYFGNGLADDIPHYWVTDFASRRAILTLPYYYHFDDQFFCMFPVAGTGLENSDMLLRNWRAELDAQ